MDRPRGRCFFCMAFHIMIPASAVRMVICPNPAIKKLGNFSCDIPPFSDDRSNVLLLHATYFKKRNWGVDEGCLFGDYFYLEALVRMLRDWKLYW